MNRVSVDYSAVNHPWVDEHAFPPKGFAVAWFGRSLQLFLFSCYSHQSISDYSWEVYIVQSGVFAG